MNVNYCKEADVSTSFLFTEEQKDDMKAFRQWLKSIDMRSVITKVNVDGEKMYCVVVEEEEED